MPVVTRSQSKKLQLKDENVQDSLTKKSLIHALYEIEFRRVMLAQNPEHYKQIYGNKVEVSKQGSVDQLIKDLCLLIVLIFKVLFYGTKKN
jgi:hypothetical protein